ncbi:hypothetical protein CTA2_8944 [Colletotrichum tanaceti]|uniref:Aminoglycoside phosphotransferase domain-containing protein n=1 Tax=Colletotrichum tanaceti TaxID=1306861 RepID=A0A4U6XH76_9PEZI|nr:hypothetical protein CTA2_8944 [Colletotrichum tanaceti]TKW54883.1 hypothetical protein CTA1_5556 [Colletotrichum tanaceti]
MSSSAITDSIREVNENTWVIGDTLLLSRQASPSPASWSDSNGLFFTISQMSSPPPQTRPIDDKSVIQLIHNVGEKSAVWRIGEAYCKVKAVEYTGCTLEHTTLRFVQEKRPTAFKVPSVIYYEEHHGRYFIIQSRMEGEIMAEAWWSMDEEARDVCVSQMVSVCKELASWKGDAICGVDGLHLSEERLASGKEPDMSPEALLKNCKELGMDCSSFSFYHCDMGPGNVIRDRTNGSIGIIDWETAGYVPKEWIRTKFRVSMGLNLPGRDDDSKNDWRRRIQQQLGKEGFDDVAGAWMVWSSGKRQL